MNIIFANAIIIVIVNVMIIMIIQLFCMMILMMMIPTEASVVSKLILGEVQTQPAVFNAGSSLLLLLEVSQGSCLLQVLSNLPPISPPMKPPDPPRPPELP